MIKKIFLLVCISTILISCLDMYESKTLGILYLNDKKDSNNISDNDSIIFFKRQNLNDLNNILILGYKLKVKDNTKTELELKEIKYIENITNFYSSNYLKTMPLDNKYNNIDIKINYKKEIIVKDWDNNELSLMYTTNSSWLETVYSAIILSKMVEGKTEEELNAWVENIDENNKDLMRILKMTEKLLENSTNY